MSILQTAEQLAVRYLPERVTKQLVEWKARLPKKLWQAAPIVQMYIDDDHTRSFVGLHNFYSALLPEVATVADVELGFYAPTGHLIAKTRHDLHHFAARAVDVHAALGGKRSPFGVVTAQITPRAPRRRIYRDLGQVSSHVFMFFRDAAGPIEQTHQRSTEDAGTRPFTSTQILSTAGLEKLVVFQYNPGPRAHTLEHALVDAQTGETVATRSHAIPALGSARSVFTIAELPRIPAQLLFCVDALPASNAKPMLRRVFAGGRHSMSHA